MYFWLTTLLNTHHMNMQRNDCYDAAKMQKLTAQPPRIREVDSYETSGLLRRDPRGYEPLGGWEGRPLGLNLFVVASTGTRTRPSVALRSSEQWVVRLLTIPPAPLLGSPLVNGMVTLPGLYG